jgi:MFS family permease
VVIAAAQLMVVLDATIVNVALPHIQAALGFSGSGLEWVVNAYALTFGGLLLLAGRLCDSFGHRRMFLVGMAAFGLASACAALSADPFELVLSRAAQGVSAAMVSPAALALLGDEFPTGSRRSRAFGFWAASGSAGGVIGYTLGGVLVGYLGWRWAFIINLPITAAGIIAGRRYLPARVVSAAGRRLPLLGAASITVGLGLLIDALGQGESAGWSCCQAGPSWASAWPSARSRWPRWRPRIPARPSAVLRPASTTWRSKPAPPSAWPRSASWPSRTRTAPR